jgi:phosphatidylserine decarboxylase
VGDAGIGKRLRGGRYVTLRLTSAMYHRFHAPANCTIDDVTYISGDMWNVNPITVRRIAQLYCKNERAVIRARLSAGEEIVLVAVAAILVASIHLHCADAPLTMNYQGPRRLKARGVFERGEELGYFHHGSRSS